MNLPLTISIAAAIFFGIVSIAFSIREEKNKKLLHEKESAKRHRLYQISILKEIQDRIGYSLDIEKVVDVITGSLKNLFSYSSASSLILKDRHLIFKFHIDEPVSRTFIEQVKTSMLASLSALLGSVPEKIEEEFYGVPFDDTNTLPLASFFHIPLIVNGKVVGLINISSTHMNLYKEEEMTVLYQITAQASNALSRLQEVLENEKGKLEATIASLADGVFMVDKNSNLLLINEAGKKFLGTSKEIPTFLDILNSFKGTYDIAGKINQTIENNKPLEEKEVEIGNKIFQLFITPILVKDGTLAHSNLPNGATVMLHDITIERNLYKIKEDFTHMMVHELRSPLTSIKDSSELLLSGKSSLKEDEQEQFIKIINRQAHLLLEQISSILDAAKFESGTFALDKKDENIQDLIYESVRVIEPQAEKKKITISSHIEGPIPAVYIDKTRINQAINNLISNSIKFTQEGGRIAIEVKAVRENAEISISDTGIGISKEQQGNIFSKFYQIKTVDHHEEKEGSGLGLYIVKKIIEAHNGTISVESEEGKGTTMRITLPFQSHKEKGKSQSALYTLPN